MSGLEPLPTITGAPWVVWEPLTTGDCLTAALGLTALTLAACGLWMMWTASAQRNRQLDAQTATLARHSEILAQHSEILAQQSESLARQNETLAQHTESLARQNEGLARQSETLAALVRGLETVIERTATGTA